jgi:hypothetical protein
MTHLELRAHLPVITPHGKGRAIILIDYSPEEHLLWVVIQDDTGEIWTWPNPKVRAQFNETLDRRLALNAHTAAREEPHDKG